MSAVLNADLPRFRKVNEVLERYGYDKRWLVAILQEVQHQYRYLPEPVLNYIATSLSIPRARVFGVATFYSHFSLVAKGKHVIRICDGTACHVNRSQALLDYLYKRLRLSPTKSTSDDMLFTLEKVACLGACGLAPVVVVNDRVYGQMDVPKLEALLDGLTREEGHN